MHSKLKNIFIVIAMIIVTGWSYIMIVNRNSVNMTGRQKVLKTIYPMFAWFNKLVNKNREVISHAAVVPPVSFYSLKMVLNDGSALDMVSLKGKKILLVNTASDCGYTGQYDQLQKLYSQFNNELVIIGFPANDFKEQETGTDAAIASFCKINYGVRFPLAQKSVVVKKQNQNSIFQWLTHADQNGWNSQSPTWNFSKYLVNEDGILTGYFGPAVEPMDEEILKAIR